MLFRILAVLLLSLLFSLLFTCLLTLDETPMQFLHKVRVQSAPRTYSKIHSSLPNRNPHCNSSFPCLNMRHAHDKEFHAQDGAPQKNVIHAIPIEPNPEMDRIMAEAEARHQARPRLMPGQLSNTPKGLEHKEELVCRLPPYRVTPLPLHKEEEK